MSVSRDAIHWAYRIVLGREPAPEDVAAAATESAEPADLVRRLAESAEFSRNGRYEALFAPQVQWRPGWRRFWRLKGEPHASAAPAHDAVLWSARLLLGREPDIPSLATEIAGAGGALGIARSILASRDFADSGRREQLFGSNSAGPSRPDPDAYRGMRIADLPRKCFADARARQISGTIVFPDSQMHLLSRLRIHFTGGQSPHQISGIEINLAAIPHLEIHIADSDERVFVGAGCEGEWIVRMWGNCFAHIGPRSTANGAECYVNPGGTLIIGEDCMFADPTIHVGDNHAVFDLETLAPRNLQLRPRVTIDDHVWLGARSTILTNSRIGAGCVVGAGATVKGDIAPCSLVVGNPGKVVRSGISWTRSHDAADAREVASRLQSRQAP